MLRGVKTLGAEVVRQLGTSGAAGSGRAAGSALQTASGCTSGRAPWSDSGHTAGDALQSPTSATLRAVTSSAAAPPNTPFKANPNALHSASLATSRTATTAAAPSKAALDAYPSDSPATCNPVPPGGTRVKPRTGWRAVPEVPKVLGLAGLLPFYAFCPPLVYSAAAAAATADALQPLAAALFDVYPVAATLQIGYGTAIVSFLGAVHWGSAMQSRSGHTTKLMFERYVWSVTPALIVFPAAAAGAQTGSAIVLAALVATFALDAKFNWKGALPKWYMALRVPLAVGAVVAMLLTLWHETSVEEALSDGHRELQAVAMA